MRALSLKTLAGVLLGATCHAFQPAPCAQASNLSVETPGGKFHGFIDPSTPGVRRFLGIPYAQPPIGELRFAPPKPALPFGEIDVKKFGPSCMQFLEKEPPTIYTQIVNQFNIGGLNETSPDVSEDCLTLSVWAPACPDQGADRLPVLMFAFGGAFLMGGQDVPYQIPAQWVQETQAHLIVTLSYRLNIFGFPNAAGIAEDEQNVGLLDQRLAVEWVRDNIAAFGGDPDRITLWGQSAGAVSAGYYQYAYPKDPIVKGIIEESGSETLGAGRESTFDTTHSNFSAVAVAVGCGGLSPDQQLACMRHENVSALEIEQAIQLNNQAHPAKPVLIFTPIVDNKTVFANYTERSEAGQIANIPTIIGSNAEDGAAFIPLILGDSVNETFAADVTLAYFFCPAYLGVVNRAIADVPVYRFLYSGNFSNISPLPFLGAYHESELPLLFGTDGNFRGPSTPLEKETSKVMQDRWLAFARDGVKGMEEVGWPRYDASQDGMVEEFGAGQPVQEISVVKMDAECKVLWDKGMFGGPAS